MHRILNTRRIATAPTAIPTTTLVDIPVEDEDDGGDGADFDEGGGGLRFWVEGEPELDGGGGELRLTGLVGVLVLDGGGGDGVEDEGGLGVGVVEAGGEGVAGGGDEGVAGGGAEGVAGGGAAGVDGGGAEGLGGGEVVLLVGGEVGAGEAPGDGVVDIAQNEYQIKNETWIENAAK